MPIINAFPAAVEKKKDFFGFTFSSALVTYSDGFITEIKDYQSKFAAQMKQVNEVVLQKCASIGAEAFSSCSNLITISAKECTYIGYGAFYGCSSLTSISFPKCVTIGGYAFDYCKNLTAASFPECTSIGANAFQGCSNLINIDFPKFSSTLYGYTFTGCSKLTTASFPKCVAIQNYVFGRCDQLTTAYFPNCTTIGSSAFQYCSKMESAYFPVCTAIALGAFQSASGNLYLGAYSNTAIYTIFGKTSSTLSDSYSAAYIRITGIDIPAISRIEAYTFYSANKLRTVKAATCSSIGSHAFQYCIALYEVSFPACKTISSHAFYACSSLTKVYLMSNAVCALANSNAFTNTPIVNSTYTGAFGSIYVPAALLNSYKTASNWSYYSNRFVGI